MHGHRERLNFILAFLVAATVDFTTSQVTSECHDGKILSVILDSSQAVVKREFDQQKELLLTVLDYFPKKAAGLDLAGRVFYKSCPANEEPSPSEGFFPGHNINQNRRRINDLQYVNSADVFDVSCAMQMTEKLHENMLQHPSATRHALVFARGVAATDFVSTAFERLLRRQNIESLTVVVFANFTTHIPLIPYLSRGRLTVYRSASDNFAGLLPNVMKVVCPTLIQTNKTEDFTSSSGMSTTTAILPAVTKIAVKDAVSSTSAEISTNPLADSSNVMVSESSTMESLSTSNLPSSSWQLTSQSSELNQVTSTRSSSHSIPSSTVVLLPSPITPSSPQRYEKTSSLGLEASNIKVYSSVAHHTVSFGQTSSSNVIKEKFTSYLPTSTVQYVGAKSSLQQADSSLTQQLTPSTSISWLTQSSSGQLITSSHNARAGGIQESSTLIAPISSLLDNSIFGAASSDAPSSSATKRAITHVDMTSLHYSLLPHLPSFGTVSNDATLSMEVIHTTDVDNLPNLSPEVVNGMSTIIKTSPLIRASLPTTSIKSAFSSSVNIRHPLVAINSSSVSSMMDLGLPVLSSPPHIDAGLVSSSYSMLHSTKPTAYLFGSLISEVASTPSISQDSASSQVQSSGEETSVLVFDTKALPFSFASSANTMMPVMPDSVAIYSQDYSYLLTDKVMSHSEAVPASSQQPVVSTSAMDILLPATTHQASSPQHSSSLKQKTSSLATSVQTSSSSPLILPAPSVAVRVSRLEVSSPEVTTKLYLTSASPPLLSEVSLSSMQPGAEKIAYSSITSSFVESLYSQDTLGSTYSMSPVPFALLSSSGNPLASATNAFTSSLISSHLPFKTPLTTFMQSSVSFNSISSDAPFSTYTFSTMSSYNNIGSSTHTSLSASKMSTSMHTSPVLTYSSTFSMSSSVYSHANGTSSYMPDVIFPLSVTLQSTPSSPATSSSYSHTASYPPLQSSEYYSASGSVSLQSVSASTPLAVSTSVVLVDLIDPAVENFLNESVSANVTSNATWVQQYLNRANDVVEKVSRTKSEAEKKVSLQVVEKIEHVSFKIAKNVQPGKEVTFEGDKLTVKIAKVVPNSFHGFQFRQKNDGDTISLPGDIFQNQTNNGDVSVVAMSYKPLSGMKYDRKKFRLSDNIITITLEPRIEGDLVTPLEFTMKAMDPKNKTAKCSFWDNADSATPSGGWSDRGCYLSSLNGSHVMCHCNHMTNFAVLMQIHDVELRDVIKFSLKIITYVGCGISILGCLLLLLTYTVLSKLLRVDRNIVHFNLALAIGIANVVFLCAEPALDNKHTCLVVSIGLFYFYLASFFWMLIEGIHVYLMVVKVFKSPRKVRAYMIVGWVVPALIVAITAVRLHADFTTNEFCWLSARTGVIWAFVAPVLFIILVNTIILLITLKASYKMAITQDEFTRLKIMARLTLLLMPIFGLSWVFGVLTVNEQLIAFQYAFTAINSLQGLFIFIFYCLLNSEVRREFELAKKHSSFNDSSSSIPSLKGGAARRAHDRTRRLPNDVVTPIRMVDYIPVARMYTSESPFSGNSRASYRHNNGIVLSPDSNKMELLVLSHAGTVEEQGPSPAYSASSLVAPSSSSDPQEEICTQADVRNYIHLADAERADREAMSTTDERMCTFKDEVEA